MGSKTLPSIGRFKIDIVIQISFLNSQYVFFLISEPVQAKTWGGNLQM